MFVVFCQMFQEAHGKLKKISSEKIIKDYEHNKGLMERLDGAHDKFHYRIASVQIPRQPYVVQYEVDALMEEDEGGNALGCLVKPDRKMPMCQMTIFKDS